MFKKRSANLLQQSLKILHFETFRYFEAHKSVILQYAGRIQAEHIRLLLSKHVETFKNT